jgi:hypothetical protein
MRGVGQVARIGGDEEGAYVIDGKARGKEITRKTKDICRWILGWLLMQ